MDRRRGTRTERSEDDSHDVEPARVALEALLGEEPPSRPAQAPLLGGRDGVLRVGQRAVRAGLHFDKDDRVAVDHDQVEFPRGRGETPRQALHPELREV